MVVTSDGNTQCTLELPKSWELVVICVCATLSNYLELNDFLYTFLHYIVQFTLLSRQKTETRRTSTSLLLRDSRFSRLETWIISLCSNLFAFLAHNDSNFIKNSNVQDLSPPSNILDAGPYSHQYGWSVFNRTSFRGNNHISANILKFGATSCRAVGSHVVIVESRDWWLQIVWKQRFSFSLQSLSVPREPILITQKWRWKNSHYAPLYAFR